ncbi:hypothetical protein VCHC36A1_0373 [Vibrio cholerae HC-36A1]|nr:hypothetical protein VCHC36A1_0373 [Vibrio cholerae HC-36A1]
MIFLVVSPDIFRFFINHMKKNRFIGGVYQVDIKKLMLGSSFY